MQIFDKRPFAFACLAMIFGALLGFFASEGTIKLTVIILLICLVAVLVFAILFKRKALLTNAVLPIILAALSVFNSSHYVSKTDKAREKYISDIPVTIEATVLSCSYYSNYLCTFNIRTHIIDDNKVNLKMRLEVPYALELEEGNRIEATVILSDFESGGSFDEKQYYNSKGYYFLASELEPTCRIIEKESRSLELMLSSLNRRFSSYFEDVLDDESAGLVTAVFLGDRSELADTAKRDFTRTGTYHLLALSGMHLSLISAMIDFILRMLKVRKSGRYIALPIFIMFYAALTGFGLSVMRSAIMLFVTYVSYFVRTRRDLFSSLAFAAALIITVSPGAISDIGLWMSVTATFGIIIVMPLETYIRFKLRRLLRGLIGKGIQYLISGLLISFSAILFTLPFSCFCFGSLSLAGPLVTLILSPPVSVILFFAPVLLIFADVPIINDISVYILNACSRFVTDVAGYFSELEGIFVSLEYPFVKYIVIPFFIVFAVMLVIKIRHKIIIPVFVLICAVIFGAFEYDALNDNTIKSNYILQKQSEYITISSEGKNVLIDISDGASGRLYDAAKEAMTYGYKELDAIVLTHMHQRHINALKKLSTKEMVRRVIIPSAINETEASVAASIEYEMELLGVKVEHFELDTDYAILDDIPINLHRDYIGRSTHPVLMLELGGDADILYIGSSYPEYACVEPLAERVIIGTHGPICKKEFVLKTTEKTRLIAVADEELASFAQIEAAEETEILFFEEKIRLSPLSH